MVRRLLAIWVIFIGLAAAWIVLGGTNEARSGATDRVLHGEVQRLWGEPQNQLSPALVFRWKERREVRERVLDPETQRETVVTREQEVTCDEPVIPDRSDLEVDLRLEHRKKGLLWYSTYEVDFRGDYVYEHDEDREGTLLITYRFPTEHAVYDDFRFVVNGVMDPSIAPLSENDARVVRQEVPVRKGSRVPFRIGYRSRGLDSWRYSFGADVTRIKNFALHMTTDFREIDFPSGTISPESRERRNDGWVLDWRSENLISGFQVGMEMPRKLNPGPMAARMSFFAPVSLLFFYAWMLVITLMRRIDLHPVNYLFLGAAFFAFHLLFSYTVDHIDLLPAFLLAAAVSVFLVVSYLRLVVGARFAALEAGGSQLVYLVLFSFAHFFEGFTGLVVTIGSILTLFALMQLTGRVRWSEVFASGGLPSGAGAQTPLA